MEKPMDSGKLEFHAESAWMTNRIKLVVYARGAQVMAVAEPLTMRKVEQGEMLGAPTLELRKAEAQALMDELWRVGLRPAEGSGSAGSLAATERHLKDMQTIAMGLLHQHGMGA